MLCPLALEKKAAPLSARKSGLAYQTARLHYWFLLLFYRCPVGKLSSVSAGLEGGSDIALLARDTNPLGPI